MASRSADSEPCIYVMQNFMKFSRDEKFSESLMKVSMKISRLFTSPMDINHTDTDMEWKGQIIHYSLSTFVIVDYNE